MKLYRSYLIQQVEITFLNEITFRGLNLFSRDDYLSLYLRTKQ